ncbi:hypothetical protein AJ85_00955 [Alkalihalobacillus alcalophilus ATCC 27647 = CGMCC 1.3604]|uniref:Uncharacterized protein n=1 Tax=Alkalihalobacillus alcalophilus ATCC 27647 = CGMCC 1.3604 TaxID=1218173 RepID=A0A4S4K2L6_ALKAL|nr:hypothetical protein AJ85_00955 [Alkalihalobacillus alcalophilus ATCC 27647 = CGMCC 1.3604]
MNLIHFLMLVEAFLHQEEMLLSIVKTMKFNG